MMKKAVLVLSAILLVSCSGNKSNDNFEEVRKIEGELTRENVENLVRTGMKDKPLYSSIEIQESFTSKEDFENNQLIQKLISDSLLRYEVSNGYFKYIIDRDYETFDKYQIDHYRGGTATYKFVFDSLISVEEVPLLNAAKALIRVKKSEEGTPYKILDTLTPETKEVGVKIVKEIDGWTYGGNRKLELKSNIQPNEN